MQNQDDKGLDQWTRKVIRETQLDSPRPDFTANVMNQIVASGAMSTESIYKPLISKKYWGLIAACSATLIVLAFFVRGESSYGVVQILNNWSTEMFSMDLVPAKLFTENMAYGILALLFCLGVQVFLIKRQHARSLSM